MFFGLLIIAFHPYWRSPSAIAVSLLGWFFGIRGLILLAAPQLIARGGAMAIKAMLLIRVGFGLLALVGLWLTFVGWIAKPTKAS